MGAPFNGCGTGRKGALLLLDRARERILVGRLCLGTCFLITGIQHFMFTPFVASLIPDWFPGDAVAWTYFAGVALIAGGAGMMVPPTARLAALGIRADVAPGAIPAAG